MKRIFFLIFALLTIVCLADNAFSFEFIEYTLEDAYTDSFYATARLGNPSTIIQVSNTYERLWTGLTVDHYAEPPCINGKYKTFTYLKFDLSGYETISDAQLALYFIAEDSWDYNDDDPTTPEDESISQIKVWSIPSGSEWDEEAITWNNSIGLFDTSTATGGSVTTVGGDVGTGWYTWDVSELAQAAAGNELTLVLTSQGYFRIFASAEAVGAYSDADPRLRLDGTLATTTVPEPTSLLLFGSGLIGLALRKRE